VVSDDDRADIITCGHGRDRLVFVSSRDRDDVSTGCERITVRPN
jgi:hypothetical protein